MTETARNEPDVDNLLRDAFWRYIALVDGLERARPEDKENYGDLLRSIRVGETVKPYYDSTDAVWFMNAITQVKPRVCSEWLSRNF